MNKVETIVRTGPFILRFFILLSWMVALFMFIINPAIHGSDKDESVFQLIFLASVFLALLSLYLYFKLPKVPVTLMMFDNKNLSFTSMLNPAFGVGVHYKEKYLIDVDDILYINTYIQYIHDVGSFLYITFYCREAGVFPAFYETDKKEELFRLLDNVLDTNKNIKLVNTRDFAKAHFPAFEEKIIPEIPDSYFPSGSRRELFSEKFSKDDWQTLLLCPFLVFKSVSMADGKTDKWESRTLASMLKSSGEQRSFMVSDLLSDALENFDELFEIVLDDENINIKDVLLHAIKLVDLEGDDIDRRDFRYMLMGFAKSISESSGSGEQQISTEEKMVLDQIEKVLKMDF